MQNSPPRGALKQILPRRASRAAYPLCIPFVLLKKLKNYTWKHIFRGALRAPPIPFVFRLYSLKNIKGTTPKNDILYRGALRAPRIPFVPPFP